MKCTVSKPTSSWTEKPRIPTEGLFIFIFRILINTSIAFTVSSLINPMKLEFRGIAFVNRNNE